MKNLTHNEEVIEKQSENLKALATRLKKLKEEKYAAECYYNELLKTEKQWKKQLVMSAFVLKSNVDNNFDN